MNKPFIPVDGQSFRSHQTWIVYASRVLTSHPNYCNTERGDRTGWRGEHFTALCFDQLGRRCRNGGDMRRADEENAFPVWWVWPDQIADLFRQMAALMLTERKRLGVEAHDLHALRYRGVMELAFAGASDEEIGSISGHESKEMIRKYAGDARQIMLAKSANKKREA